jgi:hypothetical protein
MLVRRVTREAGCRFGQAIAGTAGTVVLPDDAT